jgi:FkbM family methyltransferase
MMASVNFSGISSKSLVGRALRAPLGLIPPGARMPILQGPLKGKRWLAGSHVHGCWLGSYEAEKQRSFSGVVRPGAVVYDIGANVGFYTLLSAALAGPSGKVYAFEPLPRNLRFLRRHIGINKLTNVEVIEAAVSDREGTAMFDDTANAAMGSLSARGSLKVRTVAIDDLAAQGLLRPPDMVKIDVEGAEADVLAGAARTLAAHMPAVFLATHGAEVHAACLSKLSALGYALHPVGSGDIRTCDEIRAVRP